jgi:hypothetical protein
VADIGYIESELGGEEPGRKRGLVNSFRYLLGNLLVGAPEHGKRAKNFQWYRFDVTTSSVANTEFSFSHGLGRTPTMILPMLPLNVVGSRMVDLEVTRAADGNRVYLKSPSTSAPLSVLVE